MSPRSKLLGDGRGHGLDGGVAVVETPAPKQGEHRFDGAGLCPCGVRRQLISTGIARGQFEYLTPSGWSTWLPVCRAVWQ